MEMTATNASAPPPTHDISEGKLKPPSPDSHKEWVSSHRASDDAVVAEHIADPTAWLQSSHFSSSLTSVGEDEEERDTRSGATPFLSDQSYSALEDEEMDRRDARERARRISVDDTRTAESPDVYADYVSRRIRRSSALSLQMSRRASLCSSVGDLEDDASSVTAETPAIYADHLMFKFKMNRCPRRKLSSSEILLYDDAPSAFSLGDLQA